MILGYGFWISPDFKTIAAGVAIFLLGMLSLEKGFKSFSGGLLANFLQRTTDATWKSLSFGVIATTIMQSSSLMNDSAFTYDIQNNLIDAAEIVFANLYSTERDLELTAVETDLTQSNDEEMHADAVVIDRQPGS